MHHTRMHNFYQLNEEKQTFSPFLVPFQSYFYPNIFLNDFKTNWESFQMGMTEGRKKRKKKEKEEKIKKV